MKTHILEIKELREFEGGHLGWFSKGHQDPIAFLFAVVENWDDRLEVHSSQVRHEYWRCVPVAGEHFTCTHRAKPGTRGAFPVTVVED